MSMKTLKLMMLFTAFTAVAAMPLLTSCGKDEEEKAPADPSGTYTGEISISLLGTKTPNAVAVVEKSADKPAVTGDAYSLSLKNLKISVMLAVIEIGDVTIPDVVYANGTFSGGDAQERVVGGLTGLPGVDGDEITVAVSLTGGTVKGNNLTFTLTVTNVPVMSTVPVAFNGSK